MKKDGGCTLEFAWLAAMSRHRNHSKLAADRAGDQKIRPGTILPMQIFLSISGQQSGPFTLSNVYEMKRLGSIPVDTLASCESEPDWLSLDDFLSRHPIKVPSRPSVRRSAMQKSPSRLRGLAGAFLMSIVGGALIAGFAALTGALFTIFWWGLGWANGAVAKRWARTNDQIVGLFAFVATLLGIFISGTGLEMRHNSVILFGGLGVLISLPGSLWLAFRTASTPQRPRSGRPHRRGSGRQADLQIHMKNRICWIVVVATSMAVTSCHRSHPESVVDPASGEQKYAIKLSRLSKKGDKFHLHARGTRATRNTISAQGRMATATNGVEVEIDGDLEVLQTDTIHKISKMSCTVESCLVRSNGISKPLFTNGTVVVTEQGFPKDSFFVNWSLLPKQAADLLSLVLWLNVMAGDNDELFGTDELKKVGDTWPYHAEKLNEPTLHRIGKVQLVAVTKVNSQMCMEVEANLHSANINFTIDPKATLRSANQEYTFNQIVPLDSSRPHVREISVEKTFAKIDVPTPKGIALKDLTMEVVSERWFGQQ